MESGCDHETTFQGKHPLLVQSERARSHPYKKEERYSRGRGKHGRWQTLLPDAVLMKNLSSAGEQVAFGLEFCFGTLIDRGCHFLFCPIVSCCRSTGADFRSLHWWIWAFWIVSNLLGFLPFRLLPCHKPCIVLFLKAGKFKAWVAIYISTIICLPTWLASLLELYWGILALGHFCDRFCCAWSNCHDLGSIGTLR